MISFRRGLPIGLFAVSVALTIVIASEVSAWRQDVKTYPVTAQVVDPARVDMADAPEPPGQHEAWLNQILARPLFSPDRRPLEVGVRGLPRLTGIVVTGSQRTAIFAAPSTQRPIIAQAGTHVGAYEVREISDSGVTVVGPEGTTLIKPIFDAARPASPASSPARPQTAKPVAK